MGRGAPGPAAGIARSASALGLAGPEGAAGRFGNRGEAGAASSGGGVQLLSRLWGDRAGHPPSPRAGALLNAAVTADGGWGRDGDTRVPRAVSLLLVEACTQLMLLGVGNEKR